MIDGTGAFTIDNAVAKALRDDYHRLGELVRKKCGNPLSAAELEEECKLRVSIGGRARAIGCPAGYGLKQAQQDNNRLHQLHTANAYRLHHVEVVPCPTPKMPRKRN